MKRLDALRLEFGEGVVSLPRTATIISVSEAISGSGLMLIFEHDDADDATVRRSFLLRKIGDAIPGQSHFLSTWPRHPADGGLCALYEILGADIPADVPPERHDDWRLLIDAGFTLRDDKAWLAPPDVPAGNLSAEQYMAIARLQEHGYGPIVD